jgi:bifunctional oligoribonuclease and PAP phosphatase NrnA
MEAGVKPFEMYGEIFEMKRVTDIRILGRALTTVSLEEDGRLAHMCLSLDMYRAEGAGNAYTDEFINFPRSIRGVEVTVFFKESPDRPGEVNVSLRSSGRINVSEVAAAFGGGGHARAAGCRLDGTLEEVRAKVLKAAASAVRESDER